MNTLGLMSDNHFIAAFFHERPFDLIRSQEDRLFVCGDQSGPTSAPIRPQAVQTILGHKDRTGISSGSPSAFMTAL